MDVAGMKDEDTLAGLARRGSHYAKWSKRNEGTGSEAAELGHAASKQAWKHEQASEGRAAGRRASGRALTG